MNPGYAKWQRKQKKLKKKLRKQQNRILKRSQKPNERPLVHIGETFAEKNNRREQAYSRVDHITALCNEYGAVLETRDEGRHWFVRHGQKRILDWWPSTAKAAPHLEFTACFKIRNIDELETVLVAEFEALERIEVSPEAKLIVDKLFAKDSEPTPQAVEMRYIGLGRVVPIEPMTEKAIVFREHDPTKAPWED